MPVFERAWLEYFHPDARHSIEEAGARVERQEAAVDGPGMIGASKDLCETVAKCVIDAMGGAYGSGIDMPKIAHKTLEVLTPSFRSPARAGPQDAEPSLITLLTSVAEIRNRHGTGHGRLIPSGLDFSHATLAMESANVWCRWVLITASRVLGGRAEVA